jgi:hypothetical protein
MSVGFIKIHRALFENWIADEPEALAVWVRILSEANFADKKKKFNGSIIEVKRGQLIFGLNAFSDRSGVSVMKLRRIISDMEADGMINRQKTNRYSLLTVVSYDSYQGLTSQEQAINKPLTSKQQAINTPLTTLEEGKKERRKESKNKDISPAAQVDNENLESDFDIFYLAGMVKKGRKQSLAKFKLLANKNGGSFVFANMLSTDIKKRIAVNQFGFDTLNPLTYLNNERWKDEIKAAKAPSLFVGGNGYDSPPNQYNKYDPDPNQPPVIDGDCYEA